MGQLEKNAQNEKANGLSGAAPSCFLSQAASHQLAHTTSHKRLFGGTQCHRTRLETTFHYEVVSDGCQNTVKLTMQCGSF